MMALPAVLLQALGPLGFRGALSTLARAAMLTPSVIRRSARSTDDPLMRSAKRRLALAVAVKEVLAKRMGIDRAEGIAGGVLLAVACHLQRTMYTPRGEPTSWNDFHARHHAEMSLGSIRVNEHGPIQQGADRVALTITRCRFFEALRDMDAPTLCLALCHSDEIVFNEIVPGMWFDRGGRQPDTIARGAPECTFLFTRGRL